MSLIIAYAFTPNQAGQWCHPGRANPAGCATRPCLQCMRACQRSSANWVFSPPLVSFLGGTSAPQGISCSSFKFHAFEMIQWFMH